MNKIKKLTREDKMRLSERVGRVGIPPVSENDPLNVGGVVPPTMSVPTRSQSGWRGSLRIHAWRSGAKANWPVNGR